MDTWYYLKALNKNKKMPHYPTCPYCGELMKILTKIFKVRFKTPKVPPIGANELNIFEVTPRIYKKKLLYVKGVKQNMILIMILI